MEEKAVNNLVKLTVVGISLTSLTLMGCNKKEPPSHEAAQGNGGPAEQVVTIGHAGPLTGGSSISARTTRTARGSLSKKSTRRGS